MGTTVVYYYSMLALLPLFYYILKWLVGCPQPGFRLPPGPWKLPLIGSLHHMLGQKPHRALRELSRRHGPLMYLKFGELHVVVASSRKAAEEVMKTHDAVFASRPSTPTVRILHKHGMDFALAPYGDHWRQLRKICVIQLLSAKRVQSLDIIRCEESARLVRAISSAPTPLVNLSAYLDAYANDVAMRAIMGYRLKDEKDRSTWLRYIAKAIELAGNFSLADLFPSSWLARAASHMTMKKTELYLDSVFKSMDNIISEHLMRTTQNGAHQEDMTDVLLRIHKQEGNLPVPVTMGTVKAVLFDLLGGIESIATTLEWTMAELMRNPVVMSRAQSEVRSVFMGQGYVTEDGLRRLSFLQCIIKETLRLHIPGPILLPRESRETCRVMGYDIPKGTILLVNAWAIHIDAEYWDEPEQYKPERFETDTRDFKGNDFEFTPFGAGRRMCPGMLLGLASIQIALANLLFHFDWNLPEGVLRDEIDMEENGGLSAKKKVELWLRPTMHVPFVCDN